MGLARAGREGPVGVGGGRAAGAGELCGAVGAAVFLVAAGPVGGARSAAGPRGGDLGAGAGAVS